MSDEVEDTSDDSEGDYGAIDLKYTIYSDEDSRTVYVKFEGFENNNQTDNFIEFMDMAIPLLMHQSETRH